MLNKIFKINTLIVLALVFVMTSCQKENLEDLTTTQNFTTQSLNADAQNQNRKGDKGNSGQNRGGRKCFAPVYPITLNFSDGSAVTVANKEEAKAAKVAYKEANPDATERPTIAMPFDVQLKDSTIVTIASDEDLTALKETCGSDKGNGRGRKCFAPVYPITLNFSDGSAVTVADKAAAKAAKKAYKEANPDATERPTIAYPYDVTLADETVVTVESDEDVAALKESCEGTGAGN